MEGGATLADQAVRRAWVGLEPPVHHGPARARAHRLLCDERRRRPAVRLDGDEAWARLAEHDHGVLSTRHPRRGVDAVPVAYALDDGYVGVPIDLVKPKASTRLQRERNLAADPRASLLAEHWDRHDWSQLWWVRAELRWDGDPTASREDALAGALAARYPQYHDRPFARVLVLRVVALSGWAAQPG